MSVIVRPACINDVDSICQLVNELAKYEKKKPEEVKLTKDKIVEHAFNEQPYFYLLVAEKEEKIVGYALYFFTYAASVGSPILYLEDLFLLEQYRRQGVGTQFFSELAQIVLQKNCCRMEWHTFSWNESAIQFYQSLQAVLKPELIQVRLEAPALQLLNQVNH